MRFPMRRLAALAVLAALTWLSTASAQYAYQYGYNPYTGTRADAAAGYNPYTGTRGVAENAYNPYTGTRAQDRSYHNPYTGASANVERAYNPYTGRTTYHYSYRR